MSSPTPPRALAAFFALALKLLQAEIRRNRWTEPAEVAALLGWLQGVREDQDGSMLATLAEMVDGARVTKLLLPLPEVAEALGGVSLSTVKRMVSAGTLPSVEVSGRRLVRRADLERYVTTLRPGLGAAEHKNAAPASRSRTNSGAGAGRRGSTGARVSAPGPSVAQPKGAA